MKAICSWSSASLNILSLLLYFSTCFHIKVSCLSDEQMSTVSAALASWEFNDKAVSVPQMSLNKKWQV